jgi:hypothetical protein
MADAATVVARIGVTAVIVAGFYEIIVGATELYQQTPSTWPTASSVVGISDATMAGGVDLALGIFLAFFSHLLIPVKYRTYLVGVVSGL